MPIIKQMILYYLGILKIILLRKNSLYLILDNILAGKSSEMTT